jgi:hypothetical protein
MMIPAKGWWAVFAEDGRVRAKRVVGWYSAGNKTFGGIVVFEEDGPMTADGFENFLGYAHGLDRFSAFWRKLAINGKEM